MSWVFDATPLIYLAKADRLDVIETLDEPRVVPEAVYREVVTTGVERGYDDARRIERAVEDGLVDTFAVDTDDSPVATRLARHPGLSDADVAVYREYRDRFEPIRLPHATVDNSGTAAETRSQVAALLGDA
mgnify:CR=1 FL=1